MYSFHKFSKNDDSNSASTNVKANLQLNLNQYGCNSVRQETISEIREDIEKNFFGRSKSNQNNLIAHENEDGKGSTEEIISISNQSEQFNKRIDCLNTGKEEKKRYILNLIQTKFSEGGYLALLDSLEQSFKNVHFFNLAYDEIPHY